jgi:hypothetical protein
MTQTISAHRILAELKIIGDRITEAVREPFISYYVGDAGVPNGFKSVEEFQARAEAKWASANDLIKRRNALKKALIASNAVTKVTVAGVEMTVAEAIDRKDSIDFEKSLLNNLRGQYGNVVNRIEGERRILDQKIDKRLEDEAGGKDKKSTLTEEQEDSIVKMVKKRYEPHFVDPIKAVEQIDKMWEVIRNFELEVDTALSEINARTMIEIPE